MTDTPPMVASVLDRIGYTGAVEANCHGVSLALVKSGIYPGARVARGWCYGVGSQHSWVVADGGPYDLDAHIIDLTLWSYDDTVPDIWQGTYRDGKHRPHGWGHFLSAGMPHHHGGREVRLIVNRPLSLEAREFLAMLGPLDRDGWDQVAHLPMQGWPAGEVIEAMLDTPGLAVLVPIDIQGMVTDRNPAGLYMVGDERA